MDSQITFPPKAINQIANVMATQNSADPNYMKGPELVSLFNTLGYLDAYTFSDGRGIQTIDYGEGLSRLTYVTKRLQDLNKVCQVPNAIQEFCNRVQQPSEFVDSMKKLLSPFDLEKFVPSLSTTPNDNENTSECGNFNIDERAYEIDKAKNEESKKLCHERRKALEESVLGKIPDDHPVVFISYSWDSEEHEKWVLKLSADLSAQGIFVLLDKYLEDGSNLPAYMDLGIERADKVLIIGTTKYQEKCYEPSSGVAFEDCIIRAGISRNIGTKKFIACLREGNFKISFPIYIGIKKGHDFTAEENYDKELESLCRDIYGRPIIQRPVLGDIPDYAK